MPPVPDRRNPAAASAWTFVALVIVVAAALLIRRVLVAGVVMIDDLGYSQAAYDLLSGRFRLQPWPGGQARVGLYAPVALAYALFGAGETPSLLFPLLSSLVSVVVVFAIGRMLAGERAGLVAAFLWAVSPLDILAAGSLLPDGPMTMLVAAAVGFLLAAGSRPLRDSWASYAAAAACLAWAVLVKPLALIVVPFAVVYLVLGRKVGARRAGAAIAIVAIGLAIYAGFSWIGATPAAAGSQTASFWERFAGTATDWTHRLLSEQAFAAATPLAIVAVASLLTRPEGASWAGILWAACTFLVFEFGSMSLRKYEPIPATLRASQVLPVLLPLAVVSGVHLGRTVSQRAATVAVAAASILVAICVGVLNRTGPSVSWAVTGGTPDSLSLAPFAAVALGVATFGALASAFFVDRGRPGVRAAALGLLLAAVGVASLHAAQTLVLGFRDAWHENLPAVARFVAAQPERTVYLQNHVVAARLNVASGFVLGFDYFDPAAAGGRIRLAPASVDAVTDGSLVVIDDEMLGWSAAGGLGEPPAYLRTPPVDWGLVFSAGTISGHRTRVYRLSRGRAQSDFVEASRAATSSPGVETLFRLVGAAAAARDYCASASAWTRLAAMNSAAAAPFSMPGLLKACYSQDPGAFGENLLRNGDFAAGTEAWGAGPDTNADRSVSAEPATGGRAVHVTFRGGNWAVLTQAATLEPGTAYVYAMRVRTTAPIVGLYWQADVGHPFAENQVYRDWTTLVSGFVTPAWDGKRVTALFSPVLMLAPGEAWVSDVRLVRFAPAGGR